MAAAVLGVDRGNEVDTALAATGDSQIRSPSSTSPSCDVDPGWSQYFKCQICFRYLRQPHTLECGHSFCKRCLMQLGKTTRKAHPWVPLRYLLLPCPTCRTSVLAAPILEGSIATSFIIQNLVAEWKRKRKQRKTRSRSTTVTLRSICAQTDPQDVLGLPAPSAWSDPHEEFYTRMRSGDILPFRSLSAVSCLSSSSWSEEESSDRKPDPSPVSSHTSSDDPSLGNGPHHERVHRWIARHLLAPQAEQRGDRLSNGRVLLISTWCIYSMVVVGVAQPMLPYMILFTLFFLIITLK